MLKPVIFYSTKEYYNFLKSNKTIHLFACRSGMSQSHRECADETNESYNQTTGLRNRQVQPRQGDTGTIGMGPCYQPMRSRRFLRALSDPDHLVNYMSLCPMKAKYFSDLLIEIAPRRLGDL